MARIQVHPQAELWSSKEDASRFQILTSMLDVGEIDSFLRYLVNQGHSVKNKACLGELICRYEKMRDFERVYGRDTLLNRHHPIVQSSEQLYERVKAAALPFNRV